jgi:hypothetical protein
MAGKHEKPGDDDIQSLNSVDDDTWVKILEAGVRKGKGKWMATMAGVAANRKSN